MSYILDALRKSDAQRRRGTAPALLAPQAAVATPGRPRTLSYGLLAAVLVGVGITIGSLHPWQSERRAPASEAAAARPLEPSPAPSLPSALPEQRETTRKSEPPARSKKTPPAAQSAPAPASAAARPQTPARAKAEAKVQAAQESARDAAAAQTVVAFGELPLSIQQEMPALQITAHAYSPVPRERLVGINDRVLREGEQVTPNLLIEQITLDGMIMSYKGYRFRRGVR